MVTCTCLQLFLRTLGSGFLLFLVLCFFEMVPGISLLTDRAHRRKFFDFKSTYARTTLKQLCVSVHGVRL